MKTKELAKIIYKNNEDEFDCAACDDCMFHQDEADGSITCKLNLMIFYGDSNGDVVDVDCNATLEDIEYLLEHLENDKETTVSVDKQIYEKAVKYESLVQCVKEVNDSCLNSQGTQYLEDFIKVQNGEKMKS